MVLELFGQLGAIATQQGPPDPEILKAIGLNHGLESAVADLVDNSLDAGATRILIRFVLADGLIRELLVIDDGEGMDELAIDAAMRLGHQTKQPGRALGHFGMGLKAASFSQANLLTVLSKRGRRDRPVGRRMAREQRSGGFDVEELDPEAVGRSRVEAGGGDIAAMSGTLVIWDDIRTFPKARNRSVTNTFVETKVARIRHHLGLTFHRLLAGRTFSIDIDVIDLDLGESGMPFGVEPIDPFAYIRSGDPGYPKDLLASSEAGGVILHCYIWPAGSDSHLFKLDERSAERGQGFYLYRHDRLLAHGGWANVTQEHKRRKLASGRDRDRRRFRTFLNVGREVRCSVLRRSRSCHRDSRRRRRSDIRRVLADRRSRVHGFQSEDDQASADASSWQRNSPRCKRALDREVELLEGEEPVQIKWRRSNTDDFCDVDRANRTLWLNSAFRPHVLKGSQGWSERCSARQGVAVSLFEDIFRGTFSVRRTRTAWVSGRASSTPRPWPRRTND